jgi:hypothetical protein
MLYSPLKQKITWTRSYAEYLFGNHEEDLSLAISQRLDMLIYKVLLIRRGRFCCNPTKIAARRKACRPRYDSQAAS